MNEHYNLIDAINMLLANARKILIATVLVAIVAVIISLVLPIYYEASTTFYAASPDLGSPTPIDATKDQVKVYGNDEDIDRLLSIASSNKVVQYLIDTFNLYENYEINKEDPKAKYKLQLKLEDLYTVMKTKYGGIRLSVEDQDPEQAAAMANGARGKINELAQHMIKESQYATLANYKENITDKERSRNALNDSLQSLRSRYGIINLKTQGEVLATNMAEINIELEGKRGKLSMMERLNLPKDSIARTKAEVAELGAQKNALDAQIKSYGEGVSNIQALESQINIFNAQVGITKERYNQLKAAYNAPFAGLHIVEMAETPTVKSRPIRSVIVMAATAMAFLFSCLFILMKNSLIGLKWKSN